ncbi:hypothetical protein GIY56_15900 [Paracoccus sp. YIM 132242]|uniref:Uncharacterized protein n=1 Tax=Paracoccus lichenicola TaxID=2665644 RepID=A0A6L6HU80_9RHOB|nr:hypothetical protein [Paracoccus lichenicola]MTE01773.1 hypothetical protein [Paracoccus lichenicola]
MPEIQEDTNGMVEPGAVPAAAGARLGRIPENPFFMTKKTIFQLDGPASLPPFLTRRIRWTRACCCRAAEHQAADLAVVPGGLVQLPGPLVQVRAGKLPVALPAKGPSDGMSGRTIAPGG